MVDDNNPIHVDAQDARAGQKTGTMRYVLAISLTAVIVIFAAILIL
ncbi:regulator [Sphingomonas sp. Leaf412]|nr:hypothetical protein [Sphingomonas sp. Leaf412]KQT31197.1 regulator [Sphingomonas sp. Leaf412]